MRSVGRFLTGAAALFLACSAAFGQSSEDKSHASDYADKKASLFLIEGGKPVGVSFNKADGEDLVFSYDRGGEFTVQKNADSFKFRIKRDEAYTRGRTAYNKGDWGDAVANFRPAVYPLLPLTVLPEGVSDIQPLVAMFLDSLVKDNSANEALEVAKLISKESLSDELFVAILDVADMLCLSGRNDDAFAVLRDLNVDVANYDRVSRFFETLSHLRKRGGEKECLTWYTKLSNAEGNPLKKLATLWMIYCDLVQGNRMSAEVYLSQIEGIAPTAEEFSLLKLVKGDFALGEANLLFPKIAEAGDDEKAKSAAKEAYDKKLSEAIDNFAEGIVYGRMNSEWMPELLFKAGSSYKAQGNLTASNEIFTQITILYPDDFLAAKAKSQIVKIEKKDEKKS